MTLTVRSCQLTYPQVVAGPRYRVMAALHDYGDALWLRADGKATHYWVLDGKTHTKTYPAYRVVS